MSTRHERQVAKYWGAPVPSHLKHGKGTFAKKVYGCDCRDCLPSGRRNRRSDGKPFTPRERRLRSRMKLRGKPVPPGVKHGIYTYNVYQCRCDDCRAANRAERVRTENRWRKTARGHWSTEVRDGKQVEVIHWPPATLDEAWICPDCDYKIIP